MILRVAAHAGWVLLAEKVLALKKSVTMGWILLAERALTLTAAAEEPPVPPVIIRVDSSKPNGSYTVGASIPISISFSAPVSVVGTPRLALNAGAGASASLAPGQSYPRESVAFAYTVAAGHSSADLDYASVNALQGGAIAGPDGVAASTVLPAVGGPGSLGFNKDIVIDTLAPVIVGVCVETARFPFRGTIAKVKITFSEPVLVPRTLFGQATILSPRGAPGVRLRYESGSRSWTLVFRVEAPAATPWPPIHPPIGTRVVLEVVSGYIRDKAGNDASLKFDSALACECPEGPHCARPIACLRPIACSLPEFCRTPVFCRVPEACAFPESCKLPEACRLPITCRIPEACRNPLFGGCGLPISCSGLIGRCKGDVDPLPYDPRDGENPSPIDELIREARRVAEKGGRKSLDAHLASKDFAGRLAALDAEERRLVAFHIDGVREDTE
ncbi:MAG: hypothetical protein KKA67_14765, partial [Spirochaetes bacterium]|nr:hypothetical protein [Spirochaetota bacterium]